MNVLSQLTGLLRGDGDETTADTDTGDEPTNDSTHTHWERMHATRVAPAGVRLETDTARTGDRWVKVLFVTGFPETATPGLLDRICTHPSADVDVTIYADPEDPRTSLIRFESAIKSLKVDHIEAQNRGSAKATVTERRIRDHEAVYTQLHENAQRILDVGVYLTIRGDSKEQVDTTVSSIRGELQRQRLTTKSAAYRQGDSLVTGSPVAKDNLGQTTPMLGQAAGALFPFAASTTIEESGVLYGYHATTDAPVYLDRFLRENGHNVLVAGEIGSGKSYDTKRLLLRRIAKDRDTAIVMIDPVGGFASLAAGLDAEHHVIGGTRTVNPLELRPTPDHLLEQENVSPFVERISAVMAFFESFFAYVGAPLGDRRQVLERCVREAYAQNGITADPTTHHRESPVVGDVRAVLGDVAVNPTEVLNGDDYSDGELDKWQSHAEDLRLNLEPFTPGGQFAFLNGQTEVDLTGSRVIYLDLKQFGGGSDEALAGLVMQPLYDAVYERLKATTGNTILAIDEAHYLVESPGSVEWLKRTTRHSRHLNLSLHFVTQELADFYDTDGAETFINQSSIKILHRQGNLTPEHANALGLTETQASFVRNAVVGKEGLGFSTALLDIDEGGTYPLRVTALPEEESIIEAQEASRSSNGGSEQ
ncbi:VirB4 family type IV secretion system protein [Haladaptatus sp. DYSN1]|uniref:VirB4 family type IV secretion system protein n=1 Tax=unclassified Haladaptatus TaxID=2622732 RepID=UPI002404FDB1|nr:transfer complex protein [Haladaptatus sp. DYSN1]